MHVSNCEPPDQEVSPGLEVDRFSLDFPHDRRNASGESEISLRLEPEHI